MERATAIEEKENHSQVPTSPVTALRKLLVSPLPRLRSWLRVVLYQRFFMKHGSLAGWMQEAIFFALILIVFSLLVDFDLLENFYHWSRDHEDYQADELVTLMGVTCVALAIRAILHSRSLQIEIGLRRTAEVEARRLALHDVLTGLPNRRHLIIRSEVLLAHAVNAGTAVAAIYIDLDRFKPVNDLLGHQAGDQVLQDVSVKLRELVREEDVVARIGGDEFAIFAEIGQPDDAVRLARRIVQALNESIVISGRQVSIGGSVGVSLFPGDAESGEKLLQNADTAMYRAKAAGRGNYRFFEAGMDKTQQDRAALEAELRIGIKRGEIVPYFQPLVDLSSGLVRRYEVLARWRHPVRGLLMPDTFIPLAEDAGLIGDMTTSVMRAAFAEAATWPSKAAIAVNISSIQLRDRELPSLVEELLQHAGLDPSRLELEVTESAVAEDIDHAKEMMGLLKAIGVQFALDDFGTGYSSLSHLRALPFDRVKIDRSFVTGLSRDEGSAKLVTAIIGLSHSLGLPTTAEGIEDSEVARILREMGCDEGQGWLYGKAAAAEEIQLTFRPPHLH